MSKKITISPKPTAGAADSWVKSRELHKEPMKRLTIDIPESLHRKIKAQCAMRGNKIVDEIRELLFEKYGNQ